MTPNKEALRNWVSELRSGKYPQTSGQLRDSEGAYCCLGVACEISNLGEWTGVENYLAKGDERMGSLPLAIREFYGTGSEDMVHISNESVIKVLGQEFFETLVDNVAMNTGHLNLANLNDNGATFADIADIIELEFDLCT